MDLPGMHPVSPHHHRNATLNVKKALRPFKRLKLETSALLASLSGTQTFQIKCIKPNDLGRPNVTEPALINNQGS